MLETVLVTGGSGFLGGWQIAELLRAGYQVRATLRDLARSDDVRKAVAREIEPVDRVHFFQTDLTRDEGWDEAVSGCHYVLHVASPFPVAQPQDPDDLILPARNGTLRVLRAAVAANVKRVVMTSSSSALSDPPGKRPVPITEEYWTDPDTNRATPYVKSKVLSERAAWDFMGLSGGDTEFAAIVPTTIIGPVLSRDLSASVHAIRRMLAGEMAGLPRLGFPFADVRDVARLQILAMTRPEAAGQRIAAAGQFTWFAELAAMLRKHLGGAAGKVPTRRVPSILVRMLALRDPGLRSVVHELGQERVVSAEKAKRLFGWSARPVEDSVVDCARSLLALGIVSSPS